MSKKRQSRVAKQRERMEFETSQESSPDYIKLSEINFAMPAVEYTDIVVKGVVDHDLTFLQTAFLLNLHGNMIAKTGILHGVRISKAAKRLGCDTSCFYGKDNLIDALNATGLVSLYIKNKKIHGRIFTPPKQRGHKNPIYPLSVGMTHRIALQGLLTHTESKAVIRTLLILSMHCDLATGEINTEKRACEWTEMIGMSRTSVERAIDWITEHGFAQLERDYVVTGRLNYTAMAKGFLTVHAEEEKERNAKRKADRKAGEVDSKEIETKLYKFYGLNATGWMRSHLIEAGKYLLKETFEKLDEIKMENTRRRAERRYNAPQYA